MFDVFYRGPKPGLFPFEQPAENIDEAAKRSSTRFFWYIDGGIDYTEFDFNYRSVPWEEQYIHTWPSQWQPNSQTYLVNKYTVSSRQWHYCQGPKVRLLDNTNWAVPDNIDRQQFDFSWQPDQFDDDYVYHFGTQWQSAGGPIYNPHGHAGIKIVDAQRAKATSNKTNWVIPDSVDPKSIDYTWHPNPLDPPYIYHFPSRHQSSSGVIYITPGATEIKLVDAFVVSTTEQHSNWTVPDNIDPKSIDYTWHPNPLDPPYIYHFPSQHQSASGVIYTVPGATEIKLVDAFVVTALPNKEHWYLPDYISADSIDYSWHPNPLDPPYIYQFETKWHWDRIGGPEYRVPGATEIKYLDSIVADTHCDRSLWQIPEWIDAESIDYTWVPCPADPPYIYEFAVEWGWNNIGGPEYHVPGATERKYVNYFLARTKPDPTHFEIKDNISDSDDILRWRPNPTEKPYIYIFGNQWYAPETRESARYTVAGATEIKYVNEVQAKRLPDATNYITHYACDFDYSWEPDPGSPPYNYIFGNQWWPAEIMPTVEYRMVGATESKYMDLPATLHERQGNQWQTLLDCEFDYSWCPDPGDPPYIYVFGNQWYPSTEMPTVEYHVAGATERKFLDYPQAKLLPNTECWTVPEEVDSSNIDFSWVPHPKEEPYIHHFGSEFQMSVGLTYTVPGATELKFAGDIPTIKQEKKPLQVLDIFYIDKSNASSAKRYQQLQEKHPHIQKLRYANTMMDTINRCLKRTKTAKFWVISSENVYDDFDFSWHAQPWQTYMTHVFGSQWQKWSDTFLINKWEFERHSVWAKGLEQFPNLNFVKDQPVYVPDDLHDIYYVDHGNVNSTIGPVKQRYPALKTTRYVNTYLDTFKRIMSTATTEYVWIISSLCDYTRFDFSWQPEPWQREMIHVFPSANQSRGDTFYIHVESFKQQMVDLDMLDWFNVINYCEEQRVPRLPIPYVTYRGDDLISEIKSHEFQHPYTWFTPYIRDITYNPSIWGEKDKKIVSFSNRNSTVLVPREAKNYINTQAYDYPYVAKMPMILDTPLDIVYISNGEPDAERWYNHLMDCTDPGRRVVHRVANVNGRMAAYKAAAELSSTPWFFAVFAKIEVKPEFDWDWQPDMLQEPKHYIFHARNPVNGLEYGHMGVIAYNRRLVLDTDEHGLDFTLSKPHAVVPVLSATAHYNTTPELTWRTAFREVLKLKDDVVRTDSIESKHRLKTWLTVAQGDHSEWSIRGAEDAVEYYDSVEGDYDQLLLSFEWAWLQAYWSKKYTL